MSKRALQIHLTAPPILNLHENEENSQKNPQGKNGRNLRWAYSWKGPPNKDEQECNRCWDKESYIGKIKDIEENIDITLYTKPHK